MSGYYFHTNQVLELLNSSPYKSMPTCNDGFVVLPLL